MANAGGPESRSTAEYLPILTSPGRSVDTLEAGGISESVSTCGGLVEMRPRSDVTSGAGEAKDGCAALSGNSPICVEECSAP